MLPNLAFGIAVDNTFARPGIARPTSDLHMPHPTLVTDLVHAVMYALPMPDLPVLALHMPSMMVRLEVGKGHP